MTDSNYNNTSITPDYADTPILKEKTVADSKTEVSHLLFAKHMNSAGRLFGGQLLAWIDEVAGIVARRHCEGNCTTACIDNLQFKEACFVNDIVVIIGYVTYVGKSSMEIRIDTYVERTDGSRHPVNRAFFVMVALDDNNKPFTVPRLKITSVDEEAKWEAALKRKQLREQRKNEGF